MLRLSGLLVAFAFCFLFISPQVHACSGAGEEDTIFFNVNAQPLFIERLGQKASEAQGLVELPPDAEVIAEVVLTDLKEGSPTATAKAKIRRVLKTSDARVRPGEEVLLKFNFSSCGPNHRSGHKGTIAAKVGPKTQMGLVLCPYARRFSDGRIELPAVGVGCVLSEAEKLIQAARRGNAKAQYELGAKYERDQNEAEAMIWYKLAAERGHLEAQERLEWMNQRETGDTKQNDEGR